MLLLDSNLSLLGSTQTFVASIATLIVLCSFQDKTSNFIAKLITNFNDIFLNDIKRKISKLTVSSKSNFNFLKDWNVFNNAAEKEDQQALLQIKVEADLVRNNLLNITESEKDLQNNFNQRQSSLEKKSTQILMAFYTFIFCVFILTFDALKFNETYSCIFFSLYNFIYLTFTLAAWSEFFTNSTKPQKWIISICFSLGICLIFIYLLAWQSFLCLIIILGISSAIVYLKIVSKKDIEDYNIRTITKYAILSIIITLVCSYLIYFVLQNENLISSITFINVTKLIEGLNSISCNVEWNRSMFVVLCVFNAFVLPLLLSYISGHVNFSVIRKDVDEKYDEAVAELNAIEKRYNELKENITNKSNKKQ